MFRGVLPEIPSFGGSVGRGLGAGLSAGIAQGSDIASKLFLKRAEQSQTRNLINEIENGWKKPQMGSNQSQGSPSQDQTAKFMESIQGIDQELGRELTPKDLQTLYPEWQKLQGNQQENQSQQLTNQQRPKEPQGPDLRKQAQQYEAAGLHDLARGKREEWKIEEKQKFAKDKERELTGAGAKEFWKNLQERKSSIPSAKSALEAQTDSVMSGDVDAFTRGHLADVAKQFGAPASLVALLETPGSKEFKAAQKTFLGDILRSNFRGTTTGREIDMAEGMLAQTGTSREGNLAALWLLQSKMMVDEREIELASQLKKQGYSGYDIPDLVFKRVEPYRKSLSDQYIEAIRELSGNHEQ